MNESSQSTRTATAGLEEVLSRHGFDLDSLAALGGGVALFGSRAAGAARPDSDWDVFVTADGPRNPYRSKELDVFYDDPARDPRWRHSDRAFHVLHFGLWVRGGPTWSEKDLDWDGAAAAAEARTRMFVEALLNGVRDQLSMAGRILVEARHAHCFRNRIWIPSKRMLPPEFDPGLVRPALETLTRLGALPRMYGSSGGIAWIKDETTEPSSTRTLGTCPRPSPDRPKV